MAWKVVIFGALFMIYETNGNIGDYPSSSSAAFDEGNLESISRFYNIGIIKISFSKTSLCYITFMKSCTRIKIVQKISFTYRDTKMPVYKDSRICKYKNA